MPIRIVTLISSGLPAEVAGVISEFTPVTNSKYVLLQLPLPYFASPGLGISSRRYSKLGNSGLLALIPNWAVNYPLVRKKAVMSL
ncbi:hypothetical protein D3C76_1072620 [compost metagenome]